MSKKSIEKKYGVHLERDKGYDGGAWYWLCFDSKEEMNWICNGYTLAEIEEKLCNRDKKFCLKNSVLAK